MNYSKIDAQLAAYLTRTPSSDRLPVFIYTNKKLDQSERDDLKEFGIYFSNDVPTVFSATISAEELNILSDQPWIKHIKMSTKLQPK